jgi:hypothetical protein
VKLFDRSWLNYQDRHRGLAWLTLFACALLLARVADILRAAEPVSAAAQTTTAKDQPAEAPGPFDRGGVGFLNQSSWAEFDQVLPGLVDNNQAYVTDVGPPPGLIKQWTDYPVHFFADGGFYMVHSYFSQNPAFLVKGPGTVGFRGNPPSDTFDYSVNFAPRVTLGVETATGWGIRASWLQLNESTSTGIFPSNDKTLNTTVSSVPVFGVPGFTVPSPVAKEFDVFHNNVVFNNHVRWTVWDAEAFKDFQFDRWSFLVGTGARYLYLSQEYRGASWNSGTAKLGAGKAITTFKLTEDSEFLNSGRNFAGAGPTSFLELHRRIGQTRLSLYGSARGSVLFGDIGTDSFQSTVVQGTIKPPKGKTTTVNTSTFELASTSRDHTLTMGDFEVGADWTQPYGRLLLLLRAGLVNQTIFNSGTATSSHGNVGQYGLRFTAGFNY